MKKLKICLDAGHYGKYNQSPAIPEYYESDMTWKLHLKLKAQLESYGIDVITTRKTQNENLGLTARGKASKGCDLFLSIHSNAAGSKVNESVDYPIAFVPINGSANDIGEQLAKCVSQIIGTKQKGRAESKKSEKGSWDYYSVIKGATTAGVPGIILEHSFHTNTGVTKWLLNDTNLDMLAKAEAGVIAKYFNIKAVEKLELPVLVLGIESDTVRALQVLLINKGYDCGKTGADGKFGNNTHKALKRYQEDNKLVTDGCCDLENWSKLLGLK